MTVAGRDLFNVWEGQSMQFLLLFNLTLEWPSTLALLCSNKRVITQIKIVSLVQR